MVPPPRARKRRRGRLRKRGARADVSRGAGAGRGRAPPTPARAGPARRASPLEPRPRRLVAGRSCPELAQSDPCRGAHGGMEVVLAARLRVTGGMGRVHVGGGARHLSSDEGGRFSRSRSCSYPPDEEDGLRPHARVSRRGWAGRGRLPTARPRSPLVVQPQPMAALRGSPGADLTATLPARGDRIDDAASKRQSSSRVRIVETNSSRSSRRSVETSRTINGSTSRT